MLKEIPNTTWRDRSLPTGDSSHNAAAKRPAAAIARADSQKAMPLSGLDSVTKRGMPDTESMWPKSSSPAASMAHDRMARPLERSELRAFHSTPKIIIDTTTENVSANTWYGR